MSDHVPTFSDLTNAWLVWRDISVKDASQEIQNLIDDKQYEAWDAVVDALERDLTVDDGFMIRLCEELRDANPYRKQEKTR